MSEPKTHRITAIHPKDAFTMNPDDNIKVGIIGAWQLTGTSKLDDSFSAGWFDPQDGFGLCFFAGVKVEPINGDN